MILRQVDVDHRISAAATPVTRAGTIGVRVSCGTRARIRAKGRLLSRAIAKISRTVPAWTASAQTDTAKITDSEEDLAKLGAERLLDDQGQSAGDLAQLGHGRDR